MTFFRGVPVLGGVVSTPLTELPLLIGRGGAAGFLGGGQGGQRGAAAAADGGEGGDARAKARQVVRPQPLAGERVEAVQIAVHADDQPVPIQQQRDVTRLRRLPLPHQLPRFPMNRGDAFVEAREDKVGELHGTPMVSAPRRPARKSSRMAVRGSRFAVLGSRFATARAYRLLFIVYSRSQRSRESRE